MTYVADTIARAAHVEHEWDERAIDWPGLTTDAIVVEAGGYTGRWALQMATRYWPRLYVYEPQPWAAEVCRTVLEPYGAMVFEYGLGVHDEALPMARYETDGCSFVFGDGPVCQLRDAAVVLPKDIDVMLVNIEGYEYTLLPHLMAHDLLPRRLMVQWHPQPDQFDEQAHLIAAIERTHRPLWAYGNVLMAWEVGR